MTTHTLIPYKIFAHPLLYWFLMIDLKNRYYYPYFKDKESKVLRTTHTNTKCFMLQKLFL